MALPSTVKTMGLVIVVSGLYVRDVEFKKPIDCGGDEVIEGGGEDVEGVIELVGLLSREVVDGGVEDVWDGGCEVEGGGVEVGSVLVAGGWLGEKEGDSLSAQISVQILSADLRCIRGGCRFKRWRARHSGVATSRFDRQSGV